MLFSQVPIRNSFRVNVEPLANKYYPQSIEYQNNRVTISWSGYGDSSKNVTKQRVFDYNGYPVDGYKEQDILIEDSGVFDSQYYIAKALSDDLHAVCWYSDKMGDNAIYAQLYVVGDNYRVYGKSSDIDTAFNSNSNSGPDTESNIVSSGTNDNNGDSTNDSSNAPKDVEGDGNTPTPTSNDGDNSVSNSNTENSNNNLNTEPAQSDLTQTFTSEIEKYIPHGRFISVDHDGAITANNKIAKIYRISSRVKHLDMHLDGTRTLIKIPKSSNAYYTIYSWHSKAKFDMSVFGASHYSAWNPEQGSIILHLGQNQTLVIKDKDLIDLQNQHSKDSLFFIYNVSQLDGYYLANRAEYNVTMHNNTSNTVFTNSTQEGGNTLSTGAWVGIALGLSTIVTCGVAIGRYVYRSMRNTYNDVTTPVKRGEFDSMEMEEAPDSPASDKGLKDKNYGNNADNDRSNHNNGYTGSNAYDSPASSPRGDTVHSPLSIAGMPIPFGSGMMGVLPMEYTNEAIELSPRSRESTTLLNQDTEAQRHELTPQRSRPMTLQVEVDEDANDNDNACPVAAEQDANRAYEIAEEPNMDHGLRSPSVLSEPDLEPMGGNVDVDM